MASTPMAIPKKTSVAESMSKPKYSIEFFHIYVDEEISPVHLRSLEYLKTVTKAWSIDKSTIVLIDEYSPTHGDLTPGEVCQFLEKNGAKPDYWAFEGDLVPAAEKLLDSLTDKHLTKNYRRYIEAHGKYPCSLLTATWYMTRLGAFDTSVIKRCAATEEYKPADRLINILPAGYKPVEAKAHELIAKSMFDEQADMVQDLFYEADYDRPLAVF
jgi:hypothetical protein